MDILTMGSGKNLTRLHSLKDPAATSGICLLEMLTKPQGAFPSVLACPSKALGTQLEFKAQTPDGQKDLEEERCSFSSGIWV